MSKEFWNQRYSGEEYRFGTRPNAFLAECISGALAAGKSVVCLGEGEGRNAVWLASQGYRVTAVEQSEVGIEKIQRLADEHGVHVEVVLSGIEEFAPDKTFDAVVLTYIHAPQGARELIHAKAVDLLSIDGLLLLEGYTPEQRLLGRTSGGPQALEMLFTAEMLTQDFQALEIEYLETLEIELAEGSAHQGVANVIRLLARKKG